MKKIWAFGLILWSTIVFTTENSLVIESTPKGKNPSARVKNLLRLINKNLTVFQTEIQKIEKDQAVACERRIRYREAEAIDEIARDYPHEHKLQTTFGITCWKNQEQMASQDGIPRGFATIVFKGPEFKEVYASVEWNSNFPNLTAAEEKTLMDRARRERERRTHNLK